MVCKGPMTFPFGRENIYNVSMFQAYQKVFLLYLLSLLILFKTQMAQVKDRLKKTI